MRLSAPNGSSNRRSRRRGTAGFTFAEILAALLFMALVVPVVVQGLRVASDAGTLAARKDTATRLGDALLNELAVTEEWRNGSQSGTFPGPNESYEWVVESSTWQSGVVQLDLLVTFPFRNGTHEVLLSTLVPEEQPATQSTP